jgi:hypothetical protein
MRPDLPTVPLEAGAGPENPPCPACGEPLFAWVELPVETGLAHRCEACGLGVLGRTGTTGDALADLDHDSGEDGAIIFENRASLQSLLTGGAWSGLGTDRAYRFTPESIVRLVSNRDQVLDSSRWLPGTGILMMWQSGINMFTFGHNLALGRFGRARATPSRKAWRRRLDAFITVVLAVPSMLFAVPVELIGGLIGRGGASRIRLKVL